ncbi:MAG TPA: hypothetical protein PKG52_12020 [bacterium]|nr:hypothetical protein [bacterium]HPS30485.1 hypothetical protein [bacterium]
MKNIIFLTVAIFSFAVFMISCGGEDNSKAQGSLGEECYSNGTCDYGYVCNLQVNICLEDSGNTGNTGDTGNTGNTGNTTCEPDCSGKECGSDGCDGTCGTCDNGYDCTVSAQCVKSDSCADHEDCDATMFCYQNTCQTPYGKNWKVTFISAEVTEKMPDGSGWDEGFSELPDLFASLWIGDTEAFVINSVEDSTTATWNEYKDVMFESSSEDITLCVSDFDDVSSNEDVGCWYIEDQIEYFRTQNFDWDDDAKGLVSFKFSFKPAW